MAIEKLAEKIQRERKRNGLSQEALASKLGLRRQSVSRWESGEGYPELETLVALSKCLGVTADYLLNDDHAVGGHGPWEPVPEEPAATNGSARSIPPNSSTAPSSFV